MATRGRKPLVIPTVPMKTYVPKPLAAKVELLLFDPARGKPSYAARSNLVVALLQKWVDGQITGIDTEAIMGENNPLSPSTTIEEPHVE